MVAGSLSIHCVRGSCMAHTTTAQRKPELACRLANTCTANQVDKRGRQGVDVRVRSRRFLGCVANCWASKGGSRTKGTRDECQVRRGACTAADNPRTSTFLQAKGVGIRVRLLRGTTARTLRSAWWAHEDRRQPRGGAHSFAWGDGTRAYVICSERSSAFSTGSPILYLLVLTSIPQLVPSTRSYQHNT